MSRPDYNVKEVYTGTGSLDAYTFDFLIINLQQLLIIEVNAAGVETQRVRGDDTVYLDNVVFDAVNGGGTVTLAANLPSGYNLVILLADDEPTQDYEFQNKRSFTLRRFESALDALAGAIQRISFRAKQSFRIHDLDDEETFNPQLPPGIATSNDRIITVNTAGDGLDFGPTVSEVTGLVQTAVDAATDAENAAIAAAASAVEAADSAVIAEDGALEAGMLLFDGNLNLDDGDSPVDIDPTTFHSQIVFIDADAGNVILNLQPIVNYAADFKFQIIRVDDNALNTVTVVPDGSETIDAAANYLLPTGITAILSIDNPTNWRKKFIGIANGGGSLPASGNAGDYLEHDGTAALFETGAFSGFSARYGEAFNTVGIRATLLQILNLSYLGPLVSLVGSGSGTIREKGTSVASVTLTATTTKRSDDIAAVELWSGSKIDEHVPANFPNGGAEVFTYSTPFSDNKSFQAKAIDDGTSGGPSTVNSNTVTYTFVYPYYYGAGVAGKTPAQVALLTKYVITSTATVNRSFTTSNGDVYYFAYPASYGVLTSILDENNFETISDWTLTVANITGLDASAQSYNIYAFNNPVVAGSTNYTFKR